MDKTWTTKNGDEIEISKMCDSHLLHTIAYIEKMAKDGVESKVSLGYPPDNDYQEFYTYILKGEKLLNSIEEYKWLKEEAKERGLIK